MSYKSQSYATGLVYNGYEVIESFFQSKNPRTKEQMIAKIKRIQAAAIKTDAHYDFEVAILTDEGWRSDKIFSVHEEPKIFDPATYHYEDAFEFTCDYQSFVMYNLYKPDSEGKYSGNKKNDCLYVAIRHILENKMPQGFRSPKTFKKRIGVERLDGVDISKMGIVEDLMQININVVGEHVYTSANKYNKNVNLTLIKGHYSFNAKTLVRCSKRNRKPVVFYRISGPTIHFESQQESWNEEFTSLGEIAQKYEKSFLVHSKPNKCKATKQTIPLKQDFEDFLQAREELLIASNGFVDLFEKPTMKSMALHILHHQARHLPNPDKIEPLEASWKANAF